jgi:hypothetical protein
VENYENELDVQVLMSAIRDILDSQSNRAISWVPIAFMQRDLENHVPPSDAFRLPQTPGELRTTFEVNLNRFWDNGIGIELSPPDKHEYRRKLWRVRAWVR